MQDLQPYRSSLYTWRPSLLCCLKFKVAMSSSRKESCHSIDSSIGSERSSSPMVDRNPTLSVHWYILESLVWQPLWVSQPSRHLIASIHSFVEDYHLQWQSSLMRLSHSYLWHIRIRSQCRSTVTPSYRLQWIYWSSEYNVCWLPALKNVCRPHDHPIRVVETPLYLLFKPRRWV